MDSSLPIGVFDSGMGGLTVLQSLKKLLPNESFIYLGDTARLPYGTKSAETVLRYARQMTQILIDRNIKALVIACNTATTAALKPLQDELQGFPILGVVKAGAQAAIAATSNHQIAVFATETTIASNAYQQLILEQLPGAKIKTRSCSLLVALAEEGLVDNKIAEEALRHYMTGITSEDTLLLGCTHFPVFTPLLTRLLPKTIKIVDSALATSLHLKTTLTHARLLYDKPANNNNRTHYLVTDSIKRFQQVGEIFLQESISAQHIELIDLTYYSSSQ